MLASVLAFAFGTGAQAVSAVDLIPKIHDAYSSVHSVSMKAEFRIHAGRNELQPIYLDYVRDGDSYRLSMSNGEKELFKQVVKDGDTVSMRTEGGKMTMGKAAQTEQERDPANLQFTDLWNSPDKISLNKDGLFSGGPLLIHSTHETWKGKEWVTMEELRKDAWICYYIDPKTYLVWRATNSDPKTKKVRTEWAITQLETNAKIDRQLFERP